MFTNKWPIFLHKQKIIIKIYTASKEELEIEQIIILKI
jgi:hypothetical protein